MPAVYWISAVLIALISGWSLFQILALSLENIIFLLGLVWKRVPRFPLLKLILKTFLKLGVYAGIVQAAYLYQNYVKVRVEYIEEVIWFLIAVFFVYLIVQLPQKLMFAWHISVTPAFFETYEQENRFLAKYSRKQNYY